MRVEFWGTRGSLAKPACRWPLPRRHSSPCAV